jgi:hypothetical protein
MALDAEEPASRIRPIMSSFPQSSLNAGDARQGETHGRGTVRQIVGGVPPPRLYLPSPRITRHGRAQYIEPAPAQALGRAHM